jgi:hypothetical protein
LKEDCRNDCVEALRFPRKLDNRPGLSHLDFRIGTFADIREALLRNLDKTTELSQWTHRGADDPGIALLEGAAILGDILTFYQERYANEAYLRTAEWRDSISDLVRLLGYRLSPGLGGKASFAFEIKGDQPAVIPPNFPLKAEVEGLPKPADFETVAPADVTSQTLAYPWLSKFNLFAPLTTPEITPTTNEFYVQAPDQFTAATPLVLKPGDRLLLGELDANASLRRLNNPEIVIVDSISTLHGMKVFKIKGKLKRIGNVTTLAAYKLGRSFHHFGHNGPRILVKRPDPITSTATDNGDGTTTVESQAPLELNISFFRNLGANSTSDDLTNFITAPRPQATSSSAQYPNAGYYTTSANQTYTGFVMGSSGNANTDMSSAYNYGYTTNYSANQRVVYNGQRVVIADPSLTNLQFPLDAEVQDLAAGVTLIVQGQFFANTTSSTPNERALVRDISSIKTTSVTWGLATGTVSMATLNAAMNAGGGGDGFLDIRQVLFHETLSPLLTLRAAMQPAAPATPNALNFFGTFDQAKNLLGRRLAFVKATGTPASVSVTEVVSPSANDGQHPMLHRIAIDSGSLNYADFPNQPPFIVTVYGNIVDATQGKTEKLTPLGNGDSRLVFQTFKLPKFPLTYLRSESSTPPEVPELQIYVNNRRWKRVVSFFDRKPDEEIYIVREDGENVSWVQFGDGKTGARVPSGIKNVAAVYRRGTGAFGALKKKTKVQAGAKLDGLDKIQMPQPAIDAAEPEDGENARAAAPGKIQSLDRLVSLEDFESEALGMPGITKAAATWELVDGIPQVTLTVLMGLGRTETVGTLTTTFATCNRDRGPNRFPIQPILGQLKYVGLRAHFGYDSTFLEADVRKEILKALGVSSAEQNAVDDPTGLFSLRPRNFGQREYATTVAGVIQQVEEVIWVRVDNFDAPVTLLSGGTISGGLFLNNLPIIECSNDRVLALQTGHVELVAVPEVRT